MCMKHPRRDETIFVFPDELTVENNNIQRGNRAVIPKSLHSEYLTVLHKGHQGVEAAKEGQEKVWPSISDDIVWASRVCNS